MTKSLLTSLMAIDPSCETPRTKETFNASLISSSVKPSNASNDLDDKKDTQKNKIKIK